MDWISRRMMPIVTTLRHLMAKLEAHTLHGGGQIRPSSQQAAAVSIDGREIQVN